MYIFSAIDSLSVSTDEMKNALKDLIGFQDRKFVLLYRGTRDGFLATDFRNHCNGVNDTLTIAKTTNNTVSHPEVG